jgi:general stress protein 14
MKTLVLVFHPNMAASRVNRALAERAESLGDDVVVHRMYDLYPGFRIDIAAEQQAMEAADRIVLQFPMYWFSSPPLLKKWEDDVLTYGWAYGSTGNALAGKELLVACSPGSSKYGRESDYIYTVHEFLRPFQASANLCSLTYLKPFLTIGAMAISDEDLAKRVEDYETTLKANSLPTLSDFD